MRAEIEYLHPDAVLDVDYRLQDDGDGPYIAHWDEDKLGPMPNAAVLASAKTGAARMADAASARKRLQEIDLESIALMREYIASQGDAPSGLVALQNQAAEEKAKT